MPDTLGFDAEWGVLSFRHPTIGMPDTLNTYIVNHASKFRHPTIGMPDTLRSNAVGCFDCEVVLKKLNLLRLVGLFSCGLLAKKLTGHSVLFICYEEKCYLCACRDT